MARAWGVDVIIEFRKRGVGMSSTDRRSLSINNRLLGISATGGEGLDGLQLLFESQDRIGDFRKAFYSASIFALA
jgi:hypothetical protein